MLLIRRERKNNHHITAFTIYTRYITTCMVRNAQQCRVAQKKDIMKKTAWKMLDSNGMRSWKK